MTSTSPSEEFLPGLVTKDTVNPLGLLLLGDIVGVQLLSGGTLILYYGDKRVTRITPQANQLHIEEHRVPAC